MQGPSIVMVWQRSRSRLSNALVSAGLPRKSCHAAYGKFVVSSVGFRRCRSSMSLKKMFVFSVLMLQYPSSSSYVTRNVSRFMLLKK